MGSVNNTFRNNIGYDVYNASNNTINAFYNTWSYNDPTMIDARIYDNEEGKALVEAGPKL